MKCNQCDSENVMKASLAYEMGTSSGSLNSVGVGLDSGGLSPMVARSSGQIQSRLAEKLAPPRQEGSELLSAVIAAGVTAALMVYLFDPAPRSFSGFITVLVIPIVVGAYVFKAANEQNGPKRLAAWEQYDRLWVCLRCGAIDDKEMFEDE